MISIGEIYNGLQRVSYKEANVRFDNGEEIKMLPHRANINYSGYKDSPWYRNNGDILVLIDKEQAFKKIGEMGFPDFKTCVESFEDEWCDEYNGSHAAFLVKA